MASRSRSSSSFAILILTILAWAPAAHAAGSAWPPLQTLYGDRLALAEPDSAAAAASKATSVSAPDASQPGTEAPKPHEPSNTKKALLYSLLLPGMGELSMGETGRGVGFLTAEGLIWANYAYWTVAGNLRKDNFIEQAQLNAGVGTSSGSDDYWHLVGQYDASSGPGPNTYEEELRREARDAYPTDPAAQDAYVASKLPTGNQAWSWSSSDLQQSYRTTRESSNSAYHHAKFSFGAAILNRVLSVVDVQLLRHRAAKQAQSSLTVPEYHVYADAAEDGTGRLVIQRRF